MNETLKKTLLYGIPSLIILAVLIFFIGPKVGINPLAVYGFTPLSISSPINFNLQGGVQQLVQVYLVAGGPYSNNLNIQWSPSYIQRFLPSGTQATQTVTGSITMSNELKSFPIIINNGETYYNLYYTSVGALQACPTITNAQLIQGILTGSISTPKICVYNQLYGTDASFAGSALDSFNINAQIGNLHGTLYVSPTTTAPTALSFPDGLTTLAWQGSLNNYFQLSNPTYHVLFRNSQFTQLIPSTAYGQYTGYQAQFQSCISSNYLALGLYNSQGIITCINNFNNELYQQVLPDQTFNYITGTSGVQSANFTSPSGSASGYFNVLLSEPSELPTFTLTLPASSIGITPLVAQTQIAQCISNLNIGSGKSAPQTTYIKNTGNQAGTVTVSVNCSGNLGGSVTGISQSQQIQPGQTVPFQITLPGVSTNQGTTQFSCTEVALSQAYAGGQSSSSSCNFNVGVSYAQAYACTANAISCVNANTLGVCNSLGTAYLNTTFCPNGCQAYASGGAECLAGPASCGTGYYFNSTTGSCQPNPPSCGFLGINCLLKGISNLINILKWIAVILGGLIALVFSREILAKIITVNPGIVWVVSAVIGVAVGLIIYELWWIALIVLGIYLITKLFIPKV